MISVQGKFLCNNITEEFTFFRYNRDTKFERRTKHWQKEWQVSIKKAVLPAEYVKILVRWQDVYKRQEYGGLFLQPQL